MRSQFYSAGELFQIARFQRRIIGLVLAGCFVGISLPLVSGSNNLIAALSLLGIAIAIGIMGSIWTYRLARALAQPAWLYVIFGFVPYAGVATLILLNSQATRALRANGIEVGLLGAVIPASSGSIERNH